MNQTKIKGGCQSGRKVLTHNSKSDLPLVSHFYFLATPNDQYVQPQFTQQVIPSPANEFGVQDPILQHQPISDQYEVKRENTEKTLATKAVGNDYHNPFLRRPKSVRVTVKRFDNLAEDNVDDGTKGWIPIPYPIYKN